MQSNVAYFHQVYNAHFKLSWETLLDTFAFVAYLPIFLPALSLRIKTSKKQECVSCLVFIYEYDLELRAHTERSKELPIDKHRFFSQTFRIAGMRTTHRLPKYHSNEE